MLRRRVLAAIGVCVALCALVPLSGRAEPAPPAPKKTFDKVYKWTSKDGRTVYTNLPDTVPVEQQATAEMDLSHVSLNTEIGAELDKRLAEKHDALTKTPYCKELTDRAAAPASLTIWDEYSPLIVCGAAMLVFLLLTPSMLRRVGGPAWARTLTMAIPTLAVAGIFLFVMHRGTRYVTEVRARAAPCQKETWTALAAKTDGIAQHAKLVQQLEQQMKAIEQIHAESLR